nr:MAG TPA: minor tail protein [Caudoviricetes sp.]
MAQADGSIIIDTRIDTDGVSNGTKNIKSQMQGLSGTVKKIGGIIATAFAVGKIVEFGKECLELGSDLQEVQNVVDVTFTSMSDKVDTFAKDAAKSFGLSETMAKRYVGTFGAMAKSFGFTEQEAYSMSTALTGLAGDVASFYNLSQEEAYYKLKSVFTGETETLKDLGVVMTQAALDQYALANGYGKTTQAMTEQEKVALRFAFVQEQLSAASGDFIRTSDSWANQMRVMQLQLQSIKASIGQGFINLFTPIIKSINVFLEKIATAANAFKSLTELLTGKKATESKPIQSATNDLSGLEDEYNSVSNASNNMASNTEDSANATADQAEVMQEATEAAKNYLSPLDDINRMSKETVSQETGATPSGGNGAGGNGGIIGAGVDFGEAAKGETVLDETNSLIDEIITKVKELGKLFEKGFWEGIGDYKPILSELKKDLSSIGASLKDIFTDADVQAAASRFIDSFVYNVGKMLGALTSIGLAIASNVVGGIESYLSENAERIKSHLVSLFDIGTEILDLAGGFAADFAEVFSEVISSQTAQDITGNIIGIFAEIRFGLLEITAKFRRDILEGITRPFRENKDAIKNSLLETLEPIRTVTQSLEELVQRVWDKVNSVYDGSIKPFIESISSGISDILGKLLEGYNTYIVPVLDGLSQKLSELLEGPVGTLMESVLTLLGKIFEILMVVWQEALMPVFSWIAENVMPILAPIVNIIGTVFIEAIGLLITAITSVIDTLSALLEFVKNIFTGNFKEAFVGLWNDLQQIWYNLGSYFADVFSRMYEKANEIVSKLVSFVTEKFKSLKSEVGKIWDGIKSKVVNIWNSIYSFISNKVERIKDAIVDKFNEAKNTVENIFNGIADTIRSIINNAIDIANGAIGLINDAISGVESAFTFGPWDVPTPFGDVTIGYEASFPRVPTIPYLASGAVIPPNKEFMAVLGDQKHGNNIEAPESLIRRIVREEAAGGGNKYEVALKVGRRELAKLVIDEAKLMRQQTGKNPFELA